MSRFLRARNLWTIDYGVRIKIRMKMKKIAVYSAEELRTKSHLRPKVFTETTRRR